MRKLFRCLTFAAHARSVHAHSLSYTSTRCRTFTVHACSLLYIHCTRPFAVHSLHMAARCRTFTVHARSLSYVHCTRPLAVVHCTRPLAVVHSLYTPARCRTCPLAVVHSLPTPTPVAHLAHLAHLDGRFSLSPRGRPCPSPPLLPV